MSIKDRALYERLLGDSMLERKHRDRVAAAVPLDEPSGSGS